MIGRLNFYFVILAPIINPRYCSCIVICKKIYTARHQILISNFIYNFLFNLILPLILTSFPSSKNFYETYIIFFKYKYIYIFLIYKFFCCRDSEGPEEGGANTAYQVPKGTPASRARKVPPGSPDPKVPRVPRASTDLPVSREWTGRTGFRVHPARGVLT